MRAFPDSTMPFALVLAGRGTWRATWADERLHIFVAGSDEAPFPELVATLRDLVAGWPEHRERIVAFLAARDPDEAIPLDAPRPAHLSVADARFGGEHVVFSSIAVTDRGAPTRASLIFETGEPDPYIAFRVVLEDGAPIALAAFCT